jgi:hypothetical protein
MEEVTLMKERGKSDTGKEQNKRSEYEKEQENRRKNTTH